MSDVLLSTFERANCISRSTRCLSYELEQQLTDSATTLFEDETRLLFGIRWTGDGSKHPANHGTHPRERNQRYLGADTKCLHSYAEILARVNREGHSRIPLIWPN
ncbi:uncharacterized protein ARMOST_14964 [Armillaria ostoyae]|uniref:Uncharacterized protein n=1 Tax=Armillaria ostoyae TaxID=47428 RepID=A0A284RS20_ARMOS|nr:uncharacterized protein ARMOST_14964 [Armillaria ostoyae]